MATATPKSTVVKDRRARQAVDADVLEATAGEAATPAPESVDERQARIDADRERVRRVAARTAEAIRRHNAGEPPLEDDEEI